MCLLITWEALGLSQQPVLFSAESYKLLQFIHQTLQIWENAQFLAGCRLFSTLSLFPHCQNGLHRTEWNLTTKKLKTYSSTKESKHKRLSRERFCRRSPKIETWLFVLCFLPQLNFSISTCQQSCCARWFVVRCRFLNRNHLSGAKWWLRDVIVVMSGWRWRRRKWRDHWKNSSNGSYLSLCKS